MNLIEDKRFYVYAYLDNGIPFYIGKGHGNRILYHSKYFHKNLTSIKNQKIKDCKERNSLNIIKIKSLLTEDDAYYYEKYFIDRIGIQNLTNVMRGGITGLDQVYHFKRKEVCNKISINHIDVSNGNNPKAISINQFDLEGNFIKKWDCTCMAINALKNSYSQINYETIRKSCKLQIINTKCDFIWLYADDPFEYLKNVKVVEWGKQPKRKKYKKVGSWEERFGKDKSDNMKLNLSNKLKGHNVSIETRNKISNKLKGKMSGINNPFYGRKHTDDTKLRIIKTKLKGDIRG